jgi:hypothetical protein
MCGEGCQNYVHSGCGFVVLVHEAAKAIAALDIALPRQRRRSPLRRMKCESAVGAFAVVMLDVGTKDVFEVAAADNQEPVEAFGSDGADEPLRVRIRLRPSHWCVDHVDTFAAKHLVEGKR